jgi:hypothetical protein
MRTPKHPFRLFTFEEVIALQQGTLELQCFEVRLESYDEHRTTLYSGPGVIRQLPNKRLSFTLFAKQSFDYDSLMARMSTPVGQFVPREGTFRLYAHDMSGREWTSDNVLPSFVQDNATLGTLCQGPLNDLSCSSQNHIFENSFMTCFVFADVDIPIDPPTKRQRTVSTSEGTIITHIGEAKHTFAGTNLQLIKDPNLLKIHVEAIVLPEHLDINIQQALGFALAHPLNSSIILKRQGNETVTLRHTHNDIGQTRPPIKFDDPSNIESFWQLFEAYFQYVSASPMQNQYHTISAGLRAVYRVSKQTLAAQALELTAVLESVVNTIYKSYGELSDEEKLEIDRVYKYISQLEDISDRLRDRLQGTFKNMQQTRVGDRLRALAEEGAVTKVQNKAWQELRNGSSHSFLGSSKEVQESLNLYNTVLVLFHHLVFYAIGYRGNYTDYGKPGWPTTVYNPKNSEAGE